MKWLIALALMTAPAFAFDAAEALPCMGYAPEDIGIGAEAEINLSLDQHGAPTSINVVRYQPDTDAGRRLALAAAGAVQSCAPYSNSPSFSGVIWLGPQVARNPDPAPVITMPDNADGTDNSLANELQQIINGK